MGIRKKTQAKTRKHEVDQMRRTWRKYLEVKVLGYVPLGEAVPTIASLMSLSEEYVRYVTDRFKNQKEVV